jgi:chromate transporter
MVGVMASHSRLIELAALFGRLGTVAFGGPAAHIAMMRAEVVTRRGWCTDREFLDLVSATNLIPGPNSTELAIHIGHRRAGWPGLVVAGLSFILPAVIIVSVLAWGYVHYGALPDVRRVFYGIGPVVIAIVAHALWGMARSAVTSVWLAVLGAAAVVAAAAGVHELAVLGGALVASLAGSLMSGSRRGRTAAAVILAAMTAGSRTAAAALSAASLAAATVSLPTLFWVFLKTGAVLFGSGYVLLAFLRADLVERLGWLSEAQLLDAITVGQFTPGPLFTTATFIGYVLAGPFGAALATIGIFLPAFVYVAISAPFIPRLRGSKTMGAVLDGVTVASLALMAVVTWQLGKASLVDMTTILICAVCLVVLLTTRVNSAWLILGGAVVGYFAPTLFTT